jgi:transposase-like protein
MSKDYQISSTKNSRELAEFLAANGQVILPMVDLIEQSVLAVDELIETLGKATLEAVLRMSVANVAGEEHRGKAGGEVLRHGSQRGVVALSNRKVRVEKPRLRKRGGGSGAEVAVPAYEAMRQNPNLGGRILQTMMAGVSTRNYKEILPEACECVGMSKSSVSREFVMASEEETRKLLERRFDDKRIIVIYIDGMVFDDHNIIAAVGIDDEGYKHVLGLSEGATENASVATSLLEGLVERGIKPGVKRLFVIDGSKALRKAIDAVYGEGNPVQRCRLHKERNVLSKLPGHLHDQAKSAMRAAWKLAADEGMKRLETLASWFDNEYPAAGSSLREGMSEMFTVNRLGVPQSLRRSLVSTNIVESPNSGVRMRTRRVANWQGGSMVIRWAATAFVAAEKKFRRMMGYRDLWMLSAALGYEVDTAEMVA